jgi:hypothetical protein
MIASRRQWAIAVVALAVGAGEALATNRVEGTVTYYAGGRTGQAGGASVSVIDEATGRVACTTTANSQGRYSTGALPAGRYRVKAAYRNNGRTLSGSNCCAVFRTGASPDAHMNVAVQ